MLVGIIGAPNKGKSTLFSAMTTKDVAIADYPFTTIDPNLGIAYATAECAERSLGVKCKPRNSLCDNGTRKIPVNVVDVAGLVEGAHEGKGMGNQFLNDLAAADALMLVVDASGKTDPNGNKCDGCNPSDDVKIVTKELEEWLASIIMKHMNTISKAKNGIDALVEVLAGLKVSRRAIESAAEGAMLPTAGINWTTNDAKKFAGVLIKISKPVLVVANKSDVGGAEANISALKRELGGENVIGCCAAVELALRKAASQGLIDYIPSARDFKMLKGTNTEQATALEFMRKFLIDRGTNVQQALNHAVFDMLNNIVVYPVEDENKYTDHFGNTLPDAILMKRGSTALDLATKIHTDIAKNMLYAIDARSKKRLGKDYVLNDKDVIRIVSAAK